MNARITKKLLTTPWNKLSPGWCKAIQHNDERIHNALRKWNKRNKLS